MVTVKITETYDLRTEVGKIGILGIHTPSTTQIAKVWGNVIKSHRYLRLLGCDVQMACASLLPADPLMVGTEEGKIAPQDLFNPILYTAVTNEGFDRIINRIYSRSDLLQGQSVTQPDETITDAGVYYALLAEGRFRKAMPQAGLEMRGLQPRVYELLATYGNGSSQDTTNLGSIGLDGNQLGRVPGVDGAPVASGSKIMRGISKPMPAIPCQAVYSTSSATSGTLYDASVPKTFVSCVILPPATLHVLYYRLKITWYVEFSGLRSDLETDVLTAIKTAGESYYYSAMANAKMSEKSESVDGENMSIEPVMTGYR